MSVKTKKKPAPDYWYGRPIKDDAALIRALEKDQVLNLHRNVTVYELDGDIAEAHECAFTEDLSEAVDMIEICVSDWGPDDSVCGLETFSYEEGKSMTINGRKYTWNGGRKKLVELGIIRIRPHMTTYNAEGDEYWYRDFEEPFNYLIDNGIVEYFENHVANLPEDEYKKWAKRYDL